MQPTIWKNVEILGLIDRYQRIIVSVGYDYIGEHILRACTSGWEMLPTVRVIWNLFLSYLVSDEKQSGRTTNDAALGL